MKRLWRLSLLIAFTPLLLAWQEVDGQVPAPTQPQDERSQQDALPQARDPLWGDLGQCKVGYDDKAGLYTINVTPDVKKLAGQEVTASGFVLPLDSDDKTRHFLLTKRTPVCLFCPPGEPNEVIEVTSAKPVTWTEDMINVTGTFKLVNNGDQGIFFEINDAKTEKSTVIDHFLGQNQTP